MNRKRMIFFILLSIIVAGIMACGRGVQIDQAMKKDRIPIIHEG